MVPQSSNTVLKDDEKENHETPNVMPTSDIGTPTVLATSSIFQG